MHNEWVLVDQKKMAKSFNNFYTLRDLMNKEINPLAYRFWLLMANYRTRVNFVSEALEGAETALKRLYGLYNELGTDTVGKIRIVVGDQRHIQRQRVGNHALIHWV